MGPAGVSMLVCPCSTRWRAPVLPLTPKQTDVVGSGDLLKLDLDGFVGILEAKSLRNSTISKFGFDPCEIFIQGPNLSAGRQSAMIAWLTISGAQGCQCQAEA